jgi:hypothetical protein
MASTAFNPESEAARLRHFAHALAQRGFAVFPCTIGKKPYVDHGLKEATTNPVQIDEWWQRWPTAGIAIATGAPRRFFALDVDDYHDGEASLRALLEREHAELPSTIEVITGSGQGRHLYFWHPEGRDIRNSTDKLGKGLDVRGNGGYVIAPPSPHASGGRYRWSPNSASKMADAPEWLLKLITAPKIRAPRSGRAATDWRAVALGIVGEGARNDTAARIIGHLVRCNVDGELTHEFMQLWNSAHCTPPLAPGDITKILNSICAAEMRKRGSYG